MIPRNHNLAQVAIGDLFAYVSVMLAIVRSIAMVNGAVTRIGFGLG